MPLNPTYESKTPDAEGVYSYSADENAVWAELFDRQMVNLKRHACRAYLQGQTALNLTADAVPQVKDLNARLNKISGAGVKGVAALIPQDEFSTLLSERRFPVATFIRRREDMDYLEEPDIFHEVFGHAPMLTDESFCRFMERFGTLALSLDPPLLPHLFRLFWFTVEFGLIREDGEIKAFGAGIMSSPSEVAHAMSGNAQRLPFDLETVLRTPYRIDILQPVYFVIDSFEGLADIMSSDLPSAIQQAIALGDRDAQFDAAA